MDAVAAAPSRGRRHAHLGGVAAMLPPEGVVSPGGVGYDINCGVRLLALPLSADERRALLGMGAGNHFVEVQRVDAVLDGAVAEAFGLRHGQATVLIHSGSRGLGHQVCTDHVRVMDAAIARGGLVLRDRQLACAPVSSRHRPARSRPPSVPRARRASRGRGGRAQGARARRGAS